MNGTIFFIQIYEDDKKFNDYEKNIQENFDWVKIRHDKDIQEDTGELKKAHVHYLIQTNRMSIKRISELSKVPPHYIKVRANYGFAFRYLLHLDQPEKTQYKQEELEGCQLKKRIEEFIEKDKETVALKDLVNIVTNAGKEGWNIATMINAILDAGLYGYYRQSQTTFLQLYKQLVG